MKAVPDAVDPAAGRLVSLDVFRGATIAAMLQVNNPGDWGHVFGPLRHAEWHGVTFTDLIFPFFLFIVGVAIVISASRQAGKGVSGSARLGRIARRTLLIFCLGLLLNIVAYFAAPWVETLRILGVLPRIALCYFFAALIVMWQGAAAWVVWMVALLVGYWLVMTQVSISGHGGGDLTREGNLASWLDTLALGRHNYQWMADINQGHEPEGLLSTLPAVATALSGCLAGWVLLRNSLSQTAKAGILVAAGLAALAAGHVWGQWFAVNKQLWTSSYVLVTSGWALMVLGACFWVVDVLKSRWWTKPFVVYGMNAITAYVGASLMAYITIWVKIPQPDGDPIFLKQWLYDTLYASWISPLAGPYWASAAYGFTYVVVWCALMWVLHSRRIFLRA